MIVIARMLTYIRTRQDWNLTGDQPISHDILPPNYIKNTCMSKDIDKNNRLSKKTKNDKNLWAISAVGCISINRMGSTVDWVPMGNAD